MNTKRTNSAQRRLGAKERTQRHKGFQRIPVQGNATFPSQRPKGVDSAASDSNLRRSREKRSFSGTGNAGVPSCRNTTSAARKRKGKFWFHRVNYGLGFTPASKEGWTLVILHIVLIFIWATLLLRNHVDDEMRFIWFITLFFVQTGLLMWIAHRKASA